MYLSAFVSLVAGVSALSSDISLRRDQILRRQGCNFKTATTTIAGNKVTLTGPFALTAGGGAGDSWNGKYVRSGPPGGCCDNFFVFGIPPDRKDEEATNFYLTDNGNLVSVQGGVVYTAFENNPDDPIDAHVLLGTADVIGGNPLIQCDIGGDCALDCSVTGYSYNCLGSPGYQPDWRISEAKDGAGPGCAPFTPMAVQPVAGAEGVPASMAAPSASGSASASASVSASVSASASMSGMASSSSSGAAAKKTGQGKKNGAGPANASGSAAAASGNFAAPTAAPILAANAALAIGILAAL